MDNSYRGRDQMNLVEFIKDIEKCHFRTQYDTGANSNAMFVWNLLREWAGMKELTRDDLRQKYADDQGATLEEMGAKETEYNRFKERYNG